MVQVIGPTREALVREQALRNLGAGLSENLGNEFQYQRQKGRLAEAFNKLGTEGNFLENLKQIAPDLLSTPGGAQALSELAPVLGQYSQNQAYLSALKARKGEQQPAPQPSNTPSAANQGAIPTPPKKPIASGEDFYRKPWAPSSEEGTFPQQVAGPQEQPEMSPQQIQDFATELMENSLATGKPLPLPEALNTANALNNQIIASNSRIREQKQARELVNEQRAEKFVNRASDAGLIKDDEDRTIVQRLATMSRDAPTPEDQWQFIRSGLRDFNTARNEILRKASVPGPIDTLYRKASGTYKDLKTIQQDLKGPLKAYKELGLFDEARSLLTGPVGMGIEDAESTIFPPSKQEERAIDIFPKNNVNEATVSIARSREKDFPGEQFRLNEEKYDNFKDDLGKLLEKNPNANLISLRGILNRDKRYAWQDISKAFQELIEDGRFEPDAVQRAQLTIVKEPPLPGLMQVFKYYLEGTK